ncbi:MAG: hypothetical protein KBS56_05995 [Clostridiales bacterium]|nr:hypothetical protein [Candidatus Crickella equi]
MKMRRLIAVLLSAVIAISMMPAFAMAETGILDDGTQVEFISLTGESTLANPANGDIRVKIENEEHKIDGMLGDKFKLDSPFWTLYEEEYDAEKNEWGYSTAGEFKYVWRSGSKVYEGKTDETFRGIINEQEIENGVQCDVSFALNAKDYTICTINHVVDKKMNFLDYEVEGPASVKAGSKVTFRIEGTPNLKNANLRYRWYTEKPEGTDEYVLIEGEEDDHLTVTIPKDYNEMFYAVYAQVIMDDPYEIYPQYKTDIAMGLGLIRVFQDKGAVKSKVSGTVGLNQFNAYTFKPKKKGTYKITIKNKNKDNAGLLYDLEEYKNGEWLSLNYKSTKGNSITYKLNKGKKYRFYVSARYTATEAPKYTVTVKKIKK